MIYQFVSFVLDQLNQNLSKHTLCILLTFYKSANIFPRSGEEYIEISVTTET